MSILSQQSDINKDISDICKVISENIEKIIEIEKNYVGEIQEYFTSITLPCIESAVGRILANIDYIRQCFKSSPKLTINVKAYEECFQCINSEMKRILKENEALYAKASIEEKVGLFEKLFYQCYNWKKFVDEILEYVEKCEDKVFECQYKKSLRSYNEKYFKFIFKNPLDVYDEKHEKGVKEFNENIRKLTEFQPRHELNAILAVNNILRSITEIQHEEVFICQIVIAIRLSDVMKKYPYLGKGIEVTYICHPYMEDIYHFVYIYLATEMIDDSYFSKVIAFIKNVNACLIDICEKFLEHKYVPKVFSGIYVRETRLQEREITDSYVIIRYASLTFNNIAEMFELKDNVKLSEIFLSIDLGKVCNKLNNILKAMEKVSITFLGDPSFRSVSTKSSETPENLDELVYKFAKSMKLYMHNAMRFLDRCNCVFSASKRDTLLGINLMVENKKLDDIKYTLAK